MFDYLIKWFLKWQDFEEKDFESEMKIKMEKKVLARWWSEDHLRRRAFKYLQWNSEVLTLTRSPAPPAGHSLSLHLFMPLTHAYMLKVMYSDSDNKSYILNIKRNVLITNFYALWGFVCSLLRCFQWRRTHVI